MSTNDSKNDPMSLARKMWGSMGFSSLPDMMTPTFDADEIDKKVKDLKAVESWLKMNLSMLQMTCRNTCRRLLHWPRTASLRTNRRPPDQAPGRSPAGDAQPVRDLTASESRLRAVPHGFFKSPQPLAAH